MGLSLGQALTKLQNEMPSGLDPDQTIAWLRDLVEQTDVSAPEGKAVVLFSGQVGNWHSGEIVESMVDAKPDTLWRIGQTQAGQLLEFRGPNSGDSILN